MVVPALTMEVDAFIPANLYNETLAFVNKINPKGPLHSSNLLTSLSYSTINFHVARASMETSNHTMRKT